MASYRDLEALAEIKLIVNQRKLVGRLLEVEDAVGPKRAVISRARILGDILVLHSEKLSLLHPEDKEWHEIDDDIRFTIELDKDFTLELLSGVYHLHNYGIPNQTHVTLTEVHE